MTIPIYVTMTLAEELLTCWIGPALTATALLGGTGTAGFFLNRLGENHSLHNKILDNRKDGSFTVPEIEVEDAFDKERAAQDVANEFCDSTYGLAAYDFKAPSEIQMKKALYSYYTGYKPIACFPFMSFECRAVKVNDIIANNDETNFSGTWNLAKKADQYRNGWEGAKRADKDNNSWRDARMADPSITLVDSLIQSLVASLLDQANFMAVPLIKQSHQILGVYNL